MSNFKCKRCGSFAINHHMHGRDGTGLNLCDVCFWREKYEEACWQPIETVDTNKKVSIFSKRGGVDYVAYFDKKSGNWFNANDKWIIEPLFWRERVLP